MRRLVQWILAGVMMIALNGCFGSDDTTAPVITITGGNPTTVTKGSIYTDEGATAIDAVDGTVPVITLTNDVNTAVEGTYHVVYTAIDRAGNEANATREVKVGEGDDNTAPVANAGADQKARIGDTITLDASGSHDAEDSIDDLKFEWKSGTTVLGTTKILTKDNLEMGTFVITLKVTDTQGVSNSDTVTVEVKGRILIITEVNESVVTNLNEIATIKCPTLSVDDNFSINGVQYKVVDDATIRGSGTSNNDYVHICTSLVTSMSSLFSLASNFNQSIDKWDVSAVTDMSTMFSMASSFNQPLNDWDVSAVTNMNNMFYTASSFNQALNDWNVSAVTNMGSMFSMASSFNQPLNDWDVSAVTAMYYMFYSASAFTEQNLSSWDVTNVGSNHTGFATDAGGGIIGPTWQ